MNRINFSYSACAGRYRLRSQLTGCGQKQELDQEQCRSCSNSGNRFVVRSRSRIHWRGLSARSEQSCFRVPGKITSRLVDTGQFVRAGQLLMTIDRTDYVHAITARAETVTAAKAKAVQAAADEARYRGLVKSGAISASIYDQIKAASDAAQADLAAATAQEQVRETRAATHNLLRTRTASLWRLWPSLDK